MQSVWRHDVLCPALAILLVTGGCSLFKAQDDSRLAYGATGQQAAGDSPDVRQVSYEQQEDPSLTDNLAQTFNRLTGRTSDPERAKELFGEGEALYGEALQLREQGQEGYVAKLQEAAGKFGAAASKWPDSALQHKAMFMKGESLFFADRYPEAQETYELLLKKFPNSRYLDRIQPRRFAIAEYWLNLDRQNPQSFFTYNLADESRPGRDAFGEAVRVFDRIRLDDPTGKLADDATLALGNAHFSRGRFFEADEYYTDLRKTFPSSEHQFRAHFLGLKSKLINYQGPDYSGAALEEAEKLFRQIQKQFPVEARQEREYLAKAGAELRYRQAERHWHMAQHYDRRSEYRAARLYYRQILNNFSDTPFSPQARQRLVEVGDLPDEPPQRLSFLTKLFPEDETAQPILNSEPLTR